MLSQLKDRDYELLYREFSDVNCLYTFKTSVSKLIIEVSMKKCDLSRDIWNVLACNINIHEYLKVIYDCACLYCTCIVLREGLAL